VKSTIWRFNQKMKRPESLTMNELENRSLDRGIAILEVLARLGASTLADLNRASGIPKSTIRRLLGTLQKRQLVRRSLTDKKYRININLPVSTGETIPVENSILIDVAMPILAELTNEVLWPSDFHLIEDNCMRIMDTTRLFSPFHLHRGIVNRRLNIFGSATGLACLSNIADNQIRHLIKVTKNDALWGLHRFGLDETSYFNQIEKMRALRYGVRLADSVGGTVLNDKLAAIAVPVFKQQQPIGAINLLFPRKYQDPHEFAKDYLEKLTQTAARISERIRNQQYVD